MSWGSGGLWLHVWPGGGGVWKKKAPPRIISGTALMYICRVSRILETHLFSKFPEEHAPRPPLAHGCSVQQSQWTPTTAWLWFWPGLMDAPPNVHNAPIHLQTGADDCPILSSVKSSELYTDPYLDFGQVDRQCKEVITKLNSLVPYINLGCLPTTRMGLVATWRIGLSDCLVKIQSRLHLNHSSWFNIHLERY